MPEAYGGERAQFGSWMEDLSYFVVFNLQLQETNACSFSFCVCFIVRLRFYIKIIFTLIILII